MIRADTPHVTPLRLAQILPFTCALPFDYHAYTRTIVLVPTATFFPMVVMGALSSAVEQKNGPQGARAIKGTWVSSLIASAWPDWLPHDRVGHAVDAVLRLLNLHKPGSITAIVYLGCEIMVPVIASSAFETFDCERYDDGGNYLRADLSIDCDTAAHARMQVFSGVVMAVVLVLVPTLLVSLLRPARARINPPTETELDALHSRTLDESLNPLRSIFSPFRPALWYFGVVDLYRRTAMMCLPILLRWMLPNFASHARLLVCTSFAFAVVVAYDHVAPFVTRSLGTLSRVSLVQVRRPTARTVAPSHEQPRPLVAQSFLMNFSTLVLVDRSGMVLRMSLGWFMLLENMLISMYAIGLQLKYGTAKQELERRLADHVQRQAGAVLAIQQLRSDLEKTVAHPMPLTPLEDHSRAAVVGRRKSSALGARWAQVPLVPKMLAEVDHAFSSPQYPCFGAQARVPSIRASLTVSVRGQCCVWIGCTTSKRCRRTRVSGTTRTCSKSCSSRRASRRQRTRFTSPTRRSRRRPIRCASSTG